MPQRDRGSEIAEIDGEGYTVRTVPPAYFFQESRRLELEARAELAEFRQRALVLKVAGQKKQVRCTLVLLRPRRKTTVRTVSSHANVSP